MHGVKELGGISARPYMTLLLQGAFCTDAKSGEKLTKKARGYMIAMAQHFDRKSKGMRGAGQ
jgi:hypothetical protein